MPLPAESQPGQETGLPVVVIGAGGHSKVLIDTLSLLGRTVLFATDNQASHHGKTIGGVEIRGTDAMILEQSPDRVELVNGIGSVFQPIARREVHLRLTEQGFRFATVVHPQSVVARSARLEAGAQVMAGAVVQPEVVIGTGVILNTRCSVDHDCRIGAHSHIAPGVTLSGGVTVGEGCHLGTGASVIQGVRIGDGAVVGAGAVVVHDVPDGAVVRGVPAKVN